MNKSQKLYSQMIAGALVVSAVAAPTAVGAEETTTQTVAPTGGTALNNVTTKDAVKVTGVKVGDVVKVYNGDTVIGTATSKGTSVVVTVPKKFPADVTKVHVTRTAKGLTESAKVEVAVGPEPISVALEAETVDTSTVLTNNNVKEADTVELKGVKKGDIIKVYADAEKTTLLAKGVATSSKLIVKIPKKFKTQEEPTPTVAASEKVYVTRTSVDKLESPALEETIAYEASTKLSLIATPDDATDVEATVTVNNFAGKADTVLVSGLVEKDEVILYSDADKSVVLGKGVVKKGQTSIELKVKGDLEELFINDDGTDYNSLFVSVKRGDTHPSVPAPVEVKKSEDSALTATPVVENTAKTDTVTYTGLAEKDIVKVYAVEKEFTNLAKSITDGDAILVGTAKVKKDGKAGITIKGGFKTATHTYFTTLTQEGKLESQPVKLEEATDATDTSKIAPEPTADAPADTAITVANNVVTKDTVTVSGLAADETVFVYADAAKKVLLGQAKASKDGSAVVTMKNQKAFANLAADADDKKYIYVTKKSTTKNESLTPTTKEVVGETLTTVTPIVGITNNTTSKDTVKVTYDGMTAKDVIKVYESTASGLVELTKATVKANQTEVILSLPKQVNADQKLVVTVTQYDKAESDKTVNPIDVPNTDSSSVTNLNLAITNNTTSKDTVKVTYDEQAAKDVVTVYEQTGEEGSYQYTPLAKVTVKAADEEVIVSLPKQVNAGQKLVATVTQFDKLETAKETATDVPATKSTAFEGSVTATNNVSLKDTVTVTGVKEKDVVKVYDAETGGNVIGTATVGKGKEEVTITLTKKFEEAEDSTLETQKWKKVYVEVTSVDSLPSALKSVTVGNESVTTNSAQFTATNNLTAADTIKATGLTENDVVKVYAVDPATDNSAKPIGTATVGKGKTEATITLSKPFTDSLANVYVTVTSTNLRESTAATVTPLGVPTTQVTGMVFTAENNVTKADVVKVTGVAAKDIVKVYDAETGGKVIGTATVAAGAISVDVSLKTPFNGTNPVYVTVTSPNLSPSAAQPVTPGGEAQTDKVTTGQVTPTNNVTVADVVKVTGLNAKDVVKVYDAETGGKVIGTATVAAGAAAGAGEVTITLTEQMGENVYVSLTTDNKTESDRLEVASGTAGSTAPLNDYQVETTNNVDAPDVIKVIDLVAKDVVNVYAVDPATDTTAEPIGTATVAAGATEATVTLTAPMGDSVYVTLTADNKTESTAIAVAAGTEVVTPAPKTTTISTTNVINTGGAKDTVKVTNLSPTDIVKVYKKDGEAYTEIGTATVATGATEAIVSLTESFGSTTAGNVETWTDVYVTVKKAGMNESAKTAVTPLEEGKTEKLAAAAVITTNNLTGTKDKVKVTGVVEGDVIKIYGAEDGEVLQSATVTATHASDGYIEITLKREFELDTVADLMKPIFVTRTTGTLRESDKLSVTPDKEGVTPRVDRSGVVITNNVTTADKIDITDAALAVGDIVKIYADSAKTQLIEEHTVTTVGTLSITLDKQLPETTAGSNEFKELYITNTKANKTESEAIEVTPGAEALTPNLTLIEAKVANNVTKADTVTLGKIDLTNITTSLPQTEFVAGAKVKVYDAAKNGNLLGEATVTSNDVTNGNVSVTLDKQLTVSEVYVEYQAGAARPAEERIKATVGTQISPKSFGVINYVTGADVINVTSGAYAVGDTFKFYDGTNLLGEYTVTAATDASTSPLAITLSTSLPASSVIAASLVNDMVGTAEGEKVEVSYSAEKVSRVLRKSELTLYPEKLVINVGGNNLVQIGDKVAVYDPNNSDELIAEMTMTVDGKITVPFNLKDASGNAIELPSALYNLKLTQGVANDNHAESEALSVAIEPTVPVTGATLAADGSSFTLKGAKPGFYELKDSNGAVIASDTFTTVGLVPLSSAITAAGTYTITVKEPHKVASEPFTINVTETAAGVTAAADTTLKSITLTGTVPTGITATLVKQGETTPIAGSLSNGKFTLANGAALTAATTYELTLSKLGHVPTKFKVITP